MAKNWFIIRGEGREGPLTAAQLRELAASNLLHANDLLIADGLREPVAASRLKGLLPPTPLPAPTNAGVTKYSDLRRMQFHLRVCLGLAVGGMFASSAGMWLMPRWDGIGPYPPIHPLLVIGGLLAYLPIVYSPIVAWKTTELLGWPPARRIRYTLGGVIPHIGIIPNLMLLAETATTLRSLPATPHERRPPSPLWFRSRQTATDATRWARDHIVASLLIAAGSGAVGQYAVGRLSPPAMSPEEHAAVGRRSRRAVRAVAKAILAYGQGTREESDDAIIALETALTDYVDPELSRLGRDTARLVRQWRAYDESPATTSRPGSLDEILDRLDELSPRLSLKYGDAYR